MDLNGAGWEGAMSPKEHQGCGNSSLGGIHGWSWIIPGSSWGWLQDKENSKKQEKKSIKKPPFDEKLQLNHFHPGNKTFPGQKRGIKMHLKIIYCPEPSHDKFICGAWRISLRLLALQVLRWKIEASKINSATSCLNSCDSLYSGFSGPPQEFIHWKNKTVQLLKNVQPHPN